MGPRCRTGHPEGAGRSRPRPGDPDRHRRYAGRGPTPAVRRLAGPAFRTTRRHFPAQAPRCAEPPRCRTRHPGWHSRKGRDEHGAAGVQRHGHPAREVAPRAARRATVDPDGHERAVDAERLERAHLLRLGREPGQARMLDHVVEREQAANDHLGRGDPAVADVLGTERPVDPARAGPADPQAPDRLLGHQPSLRQGLNEPEHLEAAGPEPVRKLRAGEHAAVQARQRDPLGPAARQAEGLKRPFACLQVGDHPGSPSSEPSRLGEPPTPGTHRHRDTLLAETSNCFITLSILVNPNTASERRASEWEIGHFPRLDGATGCRIRVRPPVASEGLQCGFSIPPKSAFVGTSNRGPASPCPNGEGRFAGKSTRGKCPIVS